jgi:hypothetical protein
VFSGTGTVPSYLLTGKRPAGCAGRHLAEVGSAFTCGPVTVAFAGSAEAGRVVTRDWQLFKLDVLLFRASVISEHARASPDKPGAGAATVTQLEAERACSGTCRNVERPGRPLSGCPGRKLGGLS